VSSRRHLPLLGVLASVLIVTGVASTLIKPTNPTALPTGLNVASNAESTALYCTGLTSGPGGVAGEVTFLNTATSTRSMAIQIVSDTGRRLSTSLAVPARGARSLRPDLLVKGNSFGLAAQVNGGGVVAEEVTSQRTAEVPCASAGVTSWYASGFDTLVGSNAQLSIYNPTATPAVMDVTTFSSSGFGAPAAYQGLSVAAHAQIELNLGKVVVNATNVGVRVNVLRGSVDVVGVQRSGQVVSLDPGATDTTTVSWFPRVTTVSRAVAQLRVANPGAQPANVTVNVSLPPFTVTPLTLTVAPFMSGVVVLTPNPAIPAHGYASVSMTSSEPVIATLATGAGSGIALSPALVPAKTFLLADFAGRGYDAATVTNTSSRTIGVTFSVEAKGTRHAATGTIRLDADTTSSVLGLFSGVTTLTGTTLLITASKAALLVSATLPTSPKGVTVVSPLYGG